MVQFLPSWCARELSIAVQVISEPENCHGAEFLLQAAARLDSRSISEGWCPGAGLITGPGKWLRVIQKA
jgi:hypothetical protein